MKGRITKPASASQFLLNHVKLSIIGSSVVVFFLHPIPGHFRFVIQLTWWKKGHIARSKLYPINVECYLLENLYSCYIISWLCYESFFRWYAISAFRSALLVINDDFTRGGIIVYRFTTNAQMFFFLFRFFQNALSFLCERKPSAAPKSLKEVKRRRMWQLVEKYQ